MPVVYLSPGAVLKWNVHLSCGRIRCCQGRHTLFMAPMFAWLRSMCPHCDQHPGSHCTVTSLKQEVYETNCRPALNKLSHWQDAISFCSENDLHRRQVECNLCVSVSPCSELHICKTGRFSPLTFPQPHSLRPHNWDGSWPVWARKHHQTYRPG